MATKDRARAELVTPGRLDKPVIVLRRVNVAPLSVKANKNAPSIMDRIGAGYIEQGVEERETTWFDQGLIINDQPRSSVINEEVVEHTLGFAVARTDNGEILAEGGPDSLAAMEQAASGARIELNLALSGIETAAADDEADDADEAIAAAEAQIRAEAEAAAAAAAQGTENS
jgi:hypothetical protein